MYYTPELFEKGNPSFKKNITTGYIDRKVYDENPLTHEDFKKYLDDSSRKLTQVEEYYVKTRPNMKLSTYIFTQINHLLKFILETYINTIDIKNIQKHNIIELQLLNNKLLRRLLESIWQFMASSILVITSNHGLQSITP